MDIKIDNNIVIIDLESEYDIVSMNKLLEFSESNEIRNISSIIVDFEKLKFINVLGTEIFQLRQKMVLDSVDNLIFCGLSSNMRNILYSIKSDEYEKVKKFDDLNEALIYLKA